MAASDQPLGATLKYIAIGMERITPQMAALLVALVQNKPVIRHNLDKKLLLL